MQFEEQFDDEVVEVAAVLDDLDERGQAALPRRGGGDSDGGVQLPDHCRKETASGPIITEQQGSGFIPLSKS